MKMAKPENPNGLCEGCFHRHDSRRRVEEHIQMKLERGETPPFKGIVCDPAPKAECKDHEGYGVNPPGTKTSCCDYVSWEMTRPERVMLYFIVWQGSVPFDRIDSDDEEKRTVGYLCIKQLVGWDDATKSYIPTEKGRESLSAMAKIALGRPQNYLMLAAEDQWAIDKRLGILDWDGT